MLLLKAENSSKSPQNKKIVKTKREEMNTLKPNPNIINQKMSSDAIPSKYFHNMLNNACANNSYFSRFSKMQQFQKKAQEKQSVFEEAAAIPIKSKETQIEDEDDLETFHHLPKNEQIVFNRKNFAEKAMKEERENDSAHDKENLESLLEKTTIELEISQRASQLLQRENVILKKENEGLQNEITSLKKEIVELEKNINNIVEKEVLEQKQQIQGVIDQYKEFISKLINDKKELSLNCERLLKENAILNENKSHYSENDAEDLIKMYETKNYEEKQIFIKEIEQLNQKIKAMAEDLTSKSKKSVFSSNLQEKNQLSTKINELEKELKNYKEKISYLSEEFHQKIKQKEEEYYKSYNSLEKHVKDALKKKDEIIKNLNALLEKK